MNLQMDLNGVDSTATFRQVTVNLDEKIDVRNHTISGEIVFDSEINFLDDQSVQTTAISNNRLRIDDFPSTLAQSDQAQVTGSYSLQGPTQLVEGTFEVSPTWSRGWRGSVANGDSLTPHINTADYPNSVGLYGVAFWQMQTDHNIITETIDGVDIRVDLTHASFYTAEPHRFQNVPVIPDPIIPDPEPTDPEPSEILGIRFGLFEDKGVIIIGGRGTIGVSDSAAGPFSGRIDLPAIIHPDGLAKFYKAN